MNTRTYAPYQEI